MTEPHSGERSLTSPCGNVTVRIDPGSPPKVELASGAERMFARDLADLITATARDAAEQAAAQAAEDGSAPSLDEAIGVLTGLRRELDEDGFASAIDRRRVELESPADRAARDEMRFESAPKLQLPAFVLESVDSAIGLLRGLENTGTGPAPVGEDDQPRGKATSPSKLVVVESTLEHPIASVWLSKRACEIGPKALAEEINETAAASQEDLERGREDYFEDLGLPISPSETAPAAEELTGRGDRALGDFRVLTEQQEHITRQFHQGGYFA